MCKEFDGLSSTQIGFLISEWIHDERDRQVVSRRLLDNVKFEKLAGEFDLSVTQVKTICYKAQRKLIEHI